MVAASGAVAGAVLAGGSSSIALERTVTTAHLNMFQVTAGGE